MTNNLSMKEILQIVKEHMFTPKMTLVRGPDGVARITPLPIGRTHNLVGFNEQELQMLRDNDGWDGVTLEQVVDLIASGTSRSGARTTPVIPVGPPPAPQPGQLYPNLEAVKPASNGYKFQLTDMGTMSKDENSMVFMYPSVSNAERIKITSIILNFGETIPGVYKIQMVNALGRSVPPRDIKDIQASKTTVVCINMSEIISAQTAIYFKMTPAPPVDSSGNRTPVRIQIFGETTSAPSSTPSSAPSSSSSSSLGAASSTA